MYSRKISDLGFKRGNEKIEEVVNPQEPANRRYFPTTGPSIISMQNGAIWPHDVSGIKKISIEALLCARV